MDTPSTTVGLRTLQLEPKNLMNQSQCPTKKSTAVASQPLGLFGDGV